MLLNLGDFVLYSGLEDSQVDILRNQEFDIMCIYFDKEELTYQVEVIKANLK